jgi:hypothetical protein
MQNPGCPSGRLESFPVGGAFDLCAHSAAEVVHRWGATSMLSRGFSLSLRAIRRQLAAMPCGRYLVRLIHHHTRKPYPGDRLWTASQILVEATVRFLRARNREGFDIYFRPYAWSHNAGYILVDLDRAAPAVLDVMCAQGHAPCVVIETSPGHLQVWIRVSAQPLPPELATEIGRRLARLYQGDRASADWRHLGRLAGFTNQKTQRRSPDGYPPWVKVWHATAGLAPNAPCLLAAASHRLLRPTVSPCLLPPDPQVGRSSGPPSDNVSHTLAACQANVIYQTELNRLHIRQRFPHPDWSIADLWIAKELLRRGTSAAEVKSILRLASPQFPRHHADPEDYLRRTLTRAAHDIAGAPFPARDAAVFTPSFSTPPSS